MTVNRSTELHGTGGNVAHVQSFHINILSLMQQINLKKSHTDRTRKSSFLVHNRVGAHTRIPNHSAQGDCTRTAQGSHEVSNMQWSMCPSRGPGHPQGARKARTRTRTRTLTLAPASCNFRGHRAQAISHHTRSRTRARHRSTQTRTAQG